MSEATDTQHHTLSQREHAERSYDRLHQLADVFIDQVTEEPTILEKVSNNEKYGRDDVLRNPYRDDEVFMGAIASEAVTILSQITESPGSENREFFAEANRPALYEYAVLKAFELSETPVSKNTLEHRIREATGSHFDESAYDQSWANAKSKIIYLIGDKPL